MNKKTELMDEAAVNRALTRIAHEIVERNKGGENLIVVRIKTRGVKITNRLQKKIKEIESVEVQVGELDITLYRDDLKVVTADTEPELKSTKIDMDIAGKTLILIDDVLYTGRTVRAAMDAVMDRSEERRVGKECRVR